MSLNIDSTNPVINKIHCMILQIQRSAKMVRFCWCPGHVGIQMNEDADTEAGRAALSDVALDSLAVPYRDN